MKPGAAVLVCFLVAAPAGVPGADPVLEAVPHPDLSRAQPSVQEVIRRAIEQTRTTSSAEAWGTLGMLYHAHDLYGAAQVAYRNALALSPGDSRWLYYLAFLEQQTGETGSAIARYRRAAELLPDYLPLKVRLGQALLERGDIKAARALFQFVMDREPGNAAALAGLGNAAIQDQDFEAAVAYLEAALRADGAATQLHYPLALAYRQTGALEKAQTQLALGGLEGPALEDPLLETMARLSQSSRYYITLGFSASYEGRYQEAEKLFREAAGVNPDDALAHAALGRILELLSRNDEALAEFDAALTLDPHHVMAAYFKGALLEYLERDPEARALYRQALAEEPERTEIRRLLAKSLLRAGDYPQAVAEFERLARAQDSDTMVAYYLGLSRLGAGDCSAALSSLTRAIELGPLYRPALEAYARTASSCPGADGLSRARALELARRLAESDGDAGAMETLSMALAATGRSDEAAELQSTLVDAAPEDLFLRLNLEHYRRGEPADRPFREGDPVFAPKRVSTYNR